MVSNDTRNNLIVIIVIVGVAALVTGFIAQFSATVLFVANNAQQTVHMVGSDLVGNISKLNTDQRNSLTALNRTMEHFTTENNINLHTLIEGVKNQTKNITAAIKHDNETNESISRGLSK